MPNSVNGSDEVSHKPIEQDSKVLKNALPQAKPRTSTPKNDGDVGSQSTNPFGDSEDDDGQERSDVEGSTNKCSINSVVDPIYATINPKIQSPKKSLDSGMSLTTSHRKSSDSSVPSTTHRRSYSCDSRASSTTTDDSKMPLISGNRSRGNVSIKGENRFWPRVEHVIKKKKFVVPVLSATMLTIFLAAHSAYAYLQDNAKFITFVADNPKFITIPSAIIGSLLLISIACTISQFSNTRECQVQAKSANDFLEKVTQNQQNDNIIKYVRLEYSNGTHSIFTFNVWESKKNFIDIDQKVINRTSKIGSVINDRPLPIMLLTGAIVANLIIPSTLYTIGGINAVQNFYQNILANNIGLSVVAGSAILAVSALCFIVHYYSKTNCTNLVYFQEGLSKNEGINEKLMNKVKQTRINVLGENHGKDAKCSSLTLEQVIVKAHSFPDTVHSIC